MRQVESPLQERPFDALEFSSTARKFVLFLTKVVQIEILGYMKQSLKSIHISKPSVVLLGEEDCLYAFRGR